MSNPYIHNSATSRAAADGVDHANATETRGRIYRLVLNAGEHGATRDEIEAALDLAHQTMSPRVRDLIRMDCLIEHPDRIRKTRRGKPATVMTAVPGKNPSLQPPPYDPVENAIQRLEALVADGRTTQEYIRKRFE